MDITFLIMGVGMIVLSLFFFRDIKQSEKATHTWLGLKAWPVNLRYRLAFFMLACGILMTVINVLAGMGVVKL
jgi:hypothetical protein